jgi:hypothetical protein
LSDYIPGIDPRSRRLRRLAFLLTGALLAATVHRPALAQKKEAKGAAPQIVVALPLAVEMGKSTKLTLRGIRVDTITGIRLHEPRSSGKVLGNAKKVPVPNGENVNQLGESEIDIEVTLPKEVAGGIVPFSVIGPGGESRPHKLIVKDDTPLVIEKEPNDGFKQAQPIVAPCVVEGSIRQAQDVDVFRFEGKRGEQLVFDLQANRFGSPLDGALTLYDDAGRALASADDSPGSIDPILRVTLPRDGAYFISVIDARDQGGPIYLYRLVVRRGK